MQYINIDLTTLQGIQHAKEVNFIVDTKIDNLVVKSALFTPVLQELFTPVDATTKKQRQAKMFAIFRHPIERHTSELRNEMYQLGIPDLQTLAQAQLIVN